MINQLNLTLWAWIESVRALRRGPAWTPFIVMFAVQGLVLLGLTQFYRLPFSLLFEPLVRLIANRAAPVVVHYPNFYAALPQLFSPLNLVLDWLLGSVIWGTAFLALYRMAAGDDPAGSAAEARRRWIPLLVLRLPIAVLPALFFALIPLLIPDGQGGLRGNELRAFRYGGFVFGVIVESLLIYGPLFLLQKERSIAGAYRDAARLCLKVPLATLLVVLVPNLLHLPLAAALRRSEQVVTRLAPETVGWIVLASVLVYVGVNYLSIAAAVRVFGARVPSGGEA